MMAACVAAIAASGTTEAASPACPATPAQLRPPVLSLDAHRGAPRVFAMQYEQTVASVVSYGSYAAAIDCAIRHYVVPHLARGRPNVVVFNEDVGLATVAIGSRGEAARNLFAAPGSPSCERQGEPCGTVAALGALTAAYAGPLTVYHSRFPGVSAPGQVFLGATDTTVRGFLGTFSALARRYGIYLVGSADLPPFAQSSAPADVSTFADPDLRPRPSSVYVATAPQIYNEVFMFGPRDVRSTGPDLLRNVVASNLKVPLTPLELELGFTPGPASGPAAVANLRPYALPGTKARIGFATSLPAFTWGPVGGNPCADVSVTYMRCLSALGANVVLQDEANPGRWTGPDGDGVEQWQPMSWMSSTYRTVSDPSVRFSYNVTAMMVGNLADLVFDGQTAITQRGFSGRRRAGCHYIGNAAFVPGEDESKFAAYAGRRRDFLAIAPWVVPDGPRAALRSVGASLAPGSGSALEDRYVETAVIADLPFPVDRRRRNCRSS